MLAVDRRRAPADPPAMARPVRAYRLSDDSEARLAALAKRHRVDHTRVVEAGLLALYRLAEPAQRAALEEVAASPYRGAPAALLDLLTVRGPMTRVELVEALGMPRGTVDSAIKRLTDDGAVGKEDGRGGRLFLAAQGKPAR